jgi:NAD(P)-dependent dehydrogenase (short-subunit alcohol dehydrogenase family)
MELAGKTAVITGASHGLGAGLAEDFARRGMRLGLCARGAPVLPDGPDVVAATLDVRDAAAMDRFCDQVAARLGAIDLWINNAGVLDPIRPLVDAGPPDWARHIEINVLGVAWGSAAFCRHRRAVGPGGTLVNISSGAGRKGYYGWSAYCAGKAAVDRLSECLALEEEASGTRILSVAPGIVETRMQEQIRASSPADFPEVDRFVRMKEEDRFSSTAWVAERLLELVYDPARRTGDVLVGLPLEHPV